MDPDRFLADLEAKPASLRRLAAALRGGHVEGIDLSDVRRVLFTGMGSSRFAALPVAARLRAAGFDAVSDLASLVTPHPGGPDTLVVGISASGGTPETVASLRTRAAATRRLALTNRPGDLAEVADVTIDLLAGEEAGGVACRTFQHTLAILLALASRLIDDGTDIAGAVARSAEATEDLLAGRQRWLPAVCELLASSPSTFLLAPAERYSSAAQGALMLREGPRRQADACETGDWLHVDVYLTLPLDYRCVVFAGSRFEPDVMAWMRERTGRCVAVGGDVEGAAVTVRYRHDEDPLVALVTEVLVAELVAATWWRQG